MNMIQEKCAEFYRYKVEISIRCRVMSSTTKSYLLSLFVPQAPRLRLEGLVFVLAMAIAVSVGLISTLSFSNIMVNPVLIAQGDDLVEAIRQHIHNTFFAGLPAQIVDMRAERVLAEGHAGIVAEFLEVLSSLKFAIKPSTASKRTGTSLNPLWRKGCGATTAWRELLVQNTYTQPCAVARLMTGSLYTHIALPSEPGKKVFSEEWDWNVVEAYAKLAVEYATQKGMTIYYPNKRTVSVSEEAFCQAIEAELSAHGVEGVDILSDDFIAQVVDAERFTQKPFAALATNLMGDLTIDVMMRANKSYAASSVVFTLSGAKVWEQSGGTNESMLLAYLRGEAVQHDSLDIFLMYTQAYGAANAVDIGFVQKLNRLYQIAYDAHQNRSTEWDTLTLLGQIEAQAKKENLIFA